MGKIKYIKDKLKEEFNLIVSDEFIVAVYGYGLEYELEQLDKLRLSFEWKDN